MTEATTATTKAKTAKPDGSPFGLPNYEIAKSDLSKMEVPQAFREFAEKGVAHAKDTYTTAAKGVADYHLKVIEIARTNTNTAFDHAHELLGVKSPSEFIELSTAHARKQFEAMAAQTKELTELAQKVTTEIAAKDWRHGR
jgi:phasin